MTNIENLFGEQLKTYLKSCFYRRLCLQNYSLGALLSTATFNSLCIIRQKYGTRIGQRSYVEPTVTIHIAYLLRVTANRIQVKRKKSRPYKFRLNRREYERHPASKISIGQSSWLLPHIHLPLLKRMGIEPYKKMPHKRPATHTSLHMQLLASLIRWRGLPWREHTCALSFPSFADFTLPLVCLPTVGKRLYMKNYLSCERNTAARASRSSSFSSYCWFDCCHHSCHNYGLIDFYI